MEREGGIKILKAMMSFAGMILSIIRNLYSCGSLFSDGALRGARYIFVTSVLMLSVTSVLDGIWEGWYCQA